MESDGRRARERLPDQSCNSAHAHGSPTRLDDTSPGQSCGLALYAIRLPPIAFIFLSQGFGSSAAHMGLTSFLLDIAPAIEGPSYIGAVNTISGVISFIPILGGTLIDFLGYEVLFALALPFISPALLASRGPTDAVSGH